MRVANDRTSAWIIATGLLLVYVVSNAPLARAETVELTVAAVHTVNVPWVGVIKRHVLPEFNRRLALRGSAFQARWIEAYGGGLYKWQDSLEGIEIGLADLGHVATLWEASKMPLQNVTYNLPFITDDLLLLVRVFNQLHEDIPAMRDAWTARNQVYLGASGVDTYHLLTTFPVTSLDDLNGRKILAPGPAATWLGGTGAVAVDGALTTYYTQLKTGVADGTVTILSGAYPYRIHEVAPYITLVGIGAQFIGALSMNLQSWHRLPVEAQSVLRELGKE